MTYHYDTLVEVRSDLPISFQWQKQGSEINHQSGSWEKHMDPLKKKRSQKQKVLKARLEGVEQEQERQLAFS